MSLWSKISSFVHGAEVKVSAVFEKIFGKDAAHRFAQGALALLKTDAGKIVTDAVEAVSTLATDGAGKKLAALEKIGVEFKAQGIALSESVLNLLLETAVAALKGNFSAA